jgi:methionyl-tRNA formyltransferase
MSEPHVANPPVFQLALTADTACAGVIDWHRPAGEIRGFVEALDRGRRVRGQHQQPTVPASATIHHLAIEVCEVRAGGTMSSYPAGTITRCDDELWVQTGRGHLAIDRILVDGDERDAAAFFAAAGFTPGDTFDTSHRWASPASASYGQAA